MKSTQAERDKLIDIAFSECDHWGLIYVVRRIAPTWAKGRSQESVEAIAKDIFDGIARRKAERERKASKAL